MRVFSFFRKHPWLINGSRAKWDLKCWGWYGHQRPCERQGWGSGAWSEEVLSGSTQVPLCLLQQTGVMSQQILQWCPWPCDARYPPSPASWSPGQKGDSSSAIWNRVVQGCLEDYNGNLVSEPKDAGHPVILQEIVGHCLIKWVVPQPTQLSNVQLLQSFLEVKSLLLLEPNKIIFAWFYSTLNFPKNATNT